MVSSRKGLGIDELKELIVSYRTIPNEACLTLQVLILNILKIYKKHLNQLLYKLWLVITQDVNFSHLDRNEIRSTFTKSHSELKRLQQKKPSKDISLSMKF